MIQITPHEVQIGVERTPLTELMKSIDEEATVKAAISADLATLFIALIHKYDISTTATFIQHALETAQEVSDNAEVDIRECDN